MLASVSILLCNVESALVLKVASLLTAEILAASSLSIFVCKTTSAASALFSSARIAAALAVASLSILFCRVLSFASLVDASESILLCNVLSLVVLVVASLSMLVCRVLSALVLKVASLSILVCKVVSFASLVDASESILVCNVQSALVLFVVSVARSNLIWSVSAVRAPLIFVILELLVAISVSNTSISPACDNVVVSNVPILEALLVVRSTRIVIFSSASRVQFLKLLLHLLRS